MAVAFVRQSAAFAGTSITITAAASGNILVVFLSAVRSTGARTVSSLACTNVTWGKVTGATSAAGGVDVEIWRGAVAGGSSGTTITATMSGTGATLSGSVIEFSGAGATRAGVANTATASSNAPSVTTAGAGGAFGDLAVACVGFGTGSAPSVQPGGDWSNATFSSNAGIVANQPNYIAPDTTAGANTASWTIGAGNWVACIGIIAGVPKTQAFATPATAAQSAALSRARIYGKVFSTPATAALSALLGRPLRLKSFGIYEAGIYNWPGSGAPANAMNLVGASFAVPFRVPLAGPLNRILLWAYTDAGIGTLTFEVHTDTGGQPTAGSFVDTASIAASSLPLHTIDRATISGFSVSLTPGTPYWLVFNSGADVVNIGSDNGPSPLPVYYSTDGGATWNLNNIAPAMPMAIMVGTDISAGAWSAAFNRLHTAYQVFAASLASFAVAFSALKNKMVNVAAATAAFSGVLAKKMIDAGFAAGNAAWGAGISKQIRRFFSGS